MLRFLRTGNPHTRTIWWVLIIVTVVTFLGGFVFLLGAGLDSTWNARATGAVATVDGESISRAEYQNAVNEQRENYRQRYGQDPAERDMKMLEVQAYRAVVLQRILNERARALGLRAHDREVVLALQTSPPAELRSQTVFQTNGQFDPQKYQAALRDPSNNWAPFEDLVRQQLPVRKLQERLFSSIKVSEPELREGYRLRFEHVVATVVLVPPNVEGEAPKIADADLDAVYEKYKSRFASGPMTQLEVLSTPKQFGEADVRAAQELAQSLVDRARRGEDFTALARDYSEGPNADRGGIVDQVLTPAEFGAELAPKVAAMDTGQVVDPVRDGGRFLLFKILEKTTKPQTGEPGLRVAQIVVKVKGSEDQLRAQFEELGKLRGRAAREGLGKAATAAGLSTTRTDFFDATNPPQTLFGVPEAADWGLGAKEKEVSPVFEGLDEFVVVQVVRQKPAGPMAKDLILDQIRRIATIDVQIDRSKPRVDAIAQAIAAGQPLEKAAAAQNLAPQRVDNVNRLQIDPRVEGAPELVGRLFAAQPGQVIGPVRGLNGWYFARLEERPPLDTALFDQMKAQVSKETLEARQRNFFDQFMARLRREAKVKDLRGDPGAGLAPPM